MRDVRPWCLWCKAFLRPGLLCELLTAGTCWAWGAAWCTKCCDHLWHKAAGASPPAGG